MHKVKVQLLRATVLASCLFGLNKAKRDAGDALRNSGQRKQCDRR